MGRMQMIERISVPIAFIILFSLVISGCIGPNNNDDRPEKTENDDDDTGYNVYEYQISATIDSGGYVLIPLPVNDPEIGYNEEEIISEIIDNIQIIRGDCEYYVENTLYGHSLNVTFSKDFHLRSHERVYDNDEKKQSDYFFDDLSMKEIGVHDRYYMYSSIGFTIQYFECYTGHIGNLDDYYPVMIDIEDVTIEKGWNSLKMR